MDSQEEIKSIPTTKQSTSHFEPSSTATTTTSTTVTTITTTKTDTTDTCVLASTLSAASVIIFMVICGLIYYFYIRKKRLRSSPSAPNLPKKETNPGNEPTAESLFNYGYQPDQDYKVPPKREKPLPRKFGEKERDIISPYHAEPKDDKDYSVPPLRNEHLNNEPPLPPNLRKKIENEKKTESEMEPNAYYLDMEAINKDSDTNDLYENVIASEDDIYINH